MATAGKKIVSAQLPNDEHARLSKECAAAGITLHDHIIRCLEFGKRLLSIEASAKKQAD